jgi:integrase/recombinase XerC
VRLPKPFSAEEYRTIHDAADPEVRALLTFLRETGLRAAEVLSITSDEARGWQPAPWWCRKAVCPRHVVVTRIVGKGSKERPIIVNRAALQAAQVLLAAGSNGSLVPWARRTMQRRLEDLSAKTGIHVHAHRFRHTLISELIENGVSIEVTADVAGHSNLNTTRRYWFASERARRQAMQQRAKGLRWKRGS